MREFKFRAWDKINKRMITHEQDFIPLKVTNFGIFRLSPLYEDDLWELIVPFNHPDWVFMPYIGLKDKNDKEIYEGDIVRCIVHNEVTVSVVIMKNSKWIGERKGYAQDDNIFYIADIEVIGNIYENPELLKEV